MKSVLLIEQQSPSLWRVVDRPATPSGLSRQFHLVEDNLLSYDRARVTLNQLKGYTNVVTYYPRTNVHRITYRRHGAATPS